jgi:manganese/zinc/iron transport system substrate-binding protein
MDFSRLTRLITPFALALGVGTAAAQATTPCDTPAINAVATTGMVADIVRNVGQDCVQVTQLMGPGVDPHLYRASEGDVLTLLDADVVFYSGLHLEARLAEIFERMNGLIPTVAVGERIPEEERLTEPVYNQTDPHAWMNVALWAYTIDAIHDELVALDPANEAFYSANAEAYHEQLAELDAYVQEQIDRIPEEQRVLVTAHDAFQYFGHGYNIEVFAPQGITTATEAGVNDIRRTIELLVTRNIPAVFVESSVPPDIVEAIVAGAEAQGHEVSIGGNLFSDAMGNDGTVEGTYIGMIRHNVDTIVSALLGQMAEATPEAEA